MPKALLVLVTIMLWNGSFAQHPELTFATPGEYELSQLTGLERAHALYDISKYEEANVLFFEELDKGSFGAIDFLAFANSLMAQSKTGLAKEFYNEYLRLTGEEYGSISDMVSSVFRQDTTSMPYSQILSGSEMAYGLNYFDGKVYVSKNGTIVAHNYNCGELGAERVVHKPVSYFINSSACSFNDGFSAIISRTDVKNRTSSFRLLHREEDGNFNVNSIKFCQEGFDYCNPYFDEANGILYFSSNQPGGYGGFDLYMSYYIKGKFQTPLNLGPQINTAKHELSPIKIKDWLYFSSNGYPSKGGFDIYKFKNVDEFNYVIFNERKFNSREDEYSMAQVRADEYIINRYSDSLSYLLSMSAPQPLHNYSGLVTNQANIPLSEAFVLISTDRQGKYVRSKNGLIEFQLPRQSEKVSITVHASGFISKTLQVAPNESWMVKLESVKSVGIVKVIDQRTLTDSSEVSYTVDVGDSVVQEEPVEQEMLDGVSKPKQGEFYVIISSARDYNNAYRSWSKWNVDIANLKIYQFSEDLYRIGFKAGDTELEAIQSLRETLEFKNDAWIIRPGTY
ncbi:MAG: hypothetical protein JXR19_02675 [Bacteroidia bacterium]